MSASGDEEVTYHNHLLGGYCAAVFVTMLTNLSISSRSLLLDLSLACSSVSLAIFLPVWRLAEEKKSFTGKTEKLLDAAMIFFSIVGYCGLLLMVWYVNAYVGAVLLTVSAATYLAWGRVRD
jgi:hypothetical protein